MAGYNLEGGKQWALLVGVSEYPPSRGFVPLPQCQADVVALASLLREGPSPFCVHVLDQSEIPTLATLKAELRRLALSAGPHDLILFYFTGHGVPLPATSGLVPVDGYRDDLLTTTLPMTEVQALLGASQAAVTLIVVDSCHAAPPGKGLALMETSTVPLHLPASGQALLFASRREEVASVLPTGTQSTFTHFLLEGLRGGAANQDGVVDLARLYTYVSEKVRTFAFEQGQPLQTPVLLARMEGEIQLRRVVPHGRIEVLPPRRRSFIGRRRELAQLATWLGDGGLATIAGLGGMGKTRLALEVVRRYGASASVVELGALGPDTEVWARIAQGLGVKSLPDVPLVEGVVGLLRNRSILLVLDGCEGLKDQVSRVVEILLDNCPSLRLLVTSRVVLGITGERVLHLKPLGVSGEHPDAVQLFAARAREIDPHFDLEAAGSARVQRLCQRVEGFPLAVEILAARLKVLNIRELEQRLDVPLRLLSGGSGRHRSLASTIAESVDLVDETAQQIFLRLSVFVGPFDVEAGEGVVGGDGVDEGEILAGLSTLGDHALVEIDQNREGITLRLLDPVREWAIAALERSGGASSWQLRHAEFYLQRWETRRELLEQWGNQGMALYLRDELQLLAALRTFQHLGEVDQSARLVVALYIPWIQLGRYDLLTTWLGASSTHLAQATPPVRFRVSYTAGLLAWRLGDIGGAQSRVNLMLQDPELSEYPLEEGKIRRLMGGVTTTAGDPGRSLVWLEEAASCFQRIGNQREWALTLKSLCFAESTLGHFEQALFHNRQALQLFRSLDQPGEVAATLASTVEILSQSGHLDEAQVALEEAKAAADRAGGIQHLFLIVLTHLGILARQAELPGAIGVLRESWPRIVLEGTLQQMAAVLDLMARITVMAGRLDPACQLLRLASDLQLSCGYKRSPLSQNLIRNTFTSLTTEQLDTYLSSTHAVTREDATARVEKLLSELSSDPPFCASK